MLSIHPDGRPECRRATLRWTHGQQVHPTFFPSLLSIHPGTHRPGGTVPSGAEGGTRHHGAATIHDLPTGEVLTSTGTAELVPDPDGSTGVTLLVNGCPARTSTSPTPAC
ncbi:hypothetical protein NKG05_00405 [Oerskovia sp. M15]